MFRIFSDLLRAHFAFFCLALLLLLIGCVLGAIGCWNLGARTTRSAGLVVFFGGKAHLLVQTKSKDNGRDSVAS